MTVSKRLVLAALAFAFALSASSGCGGDEAIETGPGPAPATEPITYTVSGGFPGFRKTLEIDAGGAATLTYAYADERSREVDFTVPDQVLDELRSDLDAAEIGGLDQVDSQCADCLYHSIEFGRERYEVDMLGIPPELDPIFDRLDEMVRRYAEDPAAISGAPR